MQNSNPHRREKIIEVVSHAASEFIQKESNTLSLITVTNVELARDFQKAIIFVTVFPDDMEKVALDFLRRNLSEFRDFVKERTRLQHVPWFEFKIDGGEKNRQRVEEISQNFS